MFTMKDIESMSPEEFTKNWRSGEIQMSALVIIGAYEEISEDEIEDN
jgi:hypothetical protein